MDGGKLLGVVSDNHIFMKKSKQTGDTNRVLGKLVHRFMGHGRRYNDGQIDRKLVPSTSALAI